MTLVEALVAMAILGFATAAILPAFMSQLRANTRNAERAAAVAAAQQRLEELRLESPGTMPTSGASAPQTIIIGKRQFEVITRYCERPALCNATSRHLLVEVSYDGRKIYDVETVFTGIT